MKLILNEKQYKLLKESPTPKIKKIGDFDIPSFNKIDDMLSWMRLNRPKFVNALSNVTDNAEKKFNTMESLFDAARKGDIKPGDMLNGIPVEQYITRQGGMRDEFVRLSKTKTDDVYLPKNSGKRVLTNDEIPKEDYNRILNKFGGEKSLSKGWKQFGKYPDRMSGWKFHVYGEDLYDSEFIYDRLLPVTNKWGVLAKVGVLQDFQPGNYQFGKKGATIYIHPDIINNGQVKDLLGDIQSALSGYKKKGTIVGDKSITDNITYRYELNDEIPKSGIGESQYKAMYTLNAEGSQYKPNNVRDLFTNKKEIVPTTIVNNDFFKDDLIDWSKINGSNNMSDYNLKISQALRTGDYSKISEGGFEEYGIDNFRDFLKYKMDLDAVQGSDNKGYWFFKVK